LTALVPEVGDNWLLGRYFLCHERIVLYVGIYLQKVFELNFVSLNCFSDTCSGYENTAGEVRNNKLQFGQVAV
jgi:hypothetical protein